MTPWETKICMLALSKRVEDEHNRRVWVMWHQEALSRMERMPDIKKFMSGHKSGGEEEIKARLLNFQKTRKNVNSR